jgi:hypothetical protein
VSGRYPVQRVCPGCEQLVAARRDGWLRAHRRLAVDIGANPNHCPAKVPGVIEPAEATHLALHAAGPTS